MEDIKALTFDTGGTILDWHTGMRDALAVVGARRGIERDWAAVANDYRRRALKKMLNHGADGPASYNIDGAHAMALEEIAEKHDLAAFDAADRAGLVQAWHELRTWPDFPAVLPRLRDRFIVASFTILSTRLIVDTARLNGLSWDAVISCEMIDAYKLLPIAYQTAARWLQLEPSQCLMVACHNFDLDAAKTQGFRTAFVHRPDEWGAAGPPDLTPNSAHDIIVDDFPGLARALGIEI